MLLGPQARTPGPSLPRSPDGGPRSPCVRLARQVVEELLSGNPHIEKESARSIADGAMMEAASVCVGQMVSVSPESPTNPCPTLPSLFLEGREGRPPAVSPRP